MAAETLDRPLREHGQRMGAHGSRVERLGV
jgi:hypothetical protein